MSAIKPMKMTDVGLDAFEKHVELENWILEQKMDGARALMTWTKEHGFTWQASGGGPLKFAAAAQHLPELQRQLLEFFDVNRLERIVLDGELMTEDGEYRVFDVVEAVRKDEPTHLVSMGDILARRIGARSMLFNTAFQQALALPMVKQVFTARGADEKRDLWERVNAAGVEGAMLKDLSGVYEPGVRTKTQLKLKLVKTADVVVTSVKRTFDHKGMVTHGSAEIALRISPEGDPTPWKSEVTGKRLSEADHRKLSSGTKAQQARALAFTYQPRELLPVGASSLIGKPLTIEEGSVVEVAYLYWGGDALVQPRIIRERLREEKLPEDCWIGQIPAYSRKSV